jgi:hypothetical protein
MSVVVALGLLGTTQALADPLTVTSGPVTAQPNSGGPFTLAGDGFSLSGAPTSGYQSGFWACNPCRASDGLILSLSSSVMGSFDGGLPGEFDHVFYEQTWLAGHLRFTAGDVTSAILAEGRTSISLPFTFAGELANYESFASRATPGSVPLFIATFTGSGTATANFRGPFNDPGGLFFADSITYDFAPASPVPEPASVLLFGTGAAGLLARRRVRRSLEQRARSMLMVPLACDPPEGRVLVQSEG